MRHKLWMWVLFVVVSVAVVACGGRAQYHAPASGGGYEGRHVSAAPAAEQSDAPLAQPGAPPPAADVESGDGAGASADFDAEEAPAREPAERRPGLGTTWGETRTSRVSTAPFVREDRSRPTALASIFYNDRAGVRAMARRAGFAELNDGRVSLGRGAVTVSLLDGNGRVLPGVDAGGRAYVVGRDGQRYTIHLRNHTGLRFEIVASVDGLDVIDGRDASPSKRGYILPEFGTLEIDGFRRSEDAVATFRFGAVEQSYAERKGKGRNVGVIGIALFRERGSEWPWSDREINRRHNADPFPGRFAEPPSGWR